MNFEAGLDLIFKQPELPRFSAKCRHCCGELFWQFGNSVDIIMEKYRIVVLCQLLKGHQKLVCFNRRRGILTAELRLTGRVVLFLLSWRCTGGAIGDFLVNSCLHAVAIFWSRVSGRLTLKDACVRKRITLEVVPIRSLVCTICVPGRLWSGSGVALI